ncbi:hypothetical protein EES41_00835 [Streptomyces sp. ADI95-16]|nr:hypothetical protein EES41_00835 [Streptomyces sp. ADI95-16]
MPAAPWYQYGAAGAFVACAGHWAAPLVGSSLHAGGRATHRSDAAGSGEG